MGCNDEKLDDDLSSEASEVVDDGGQDAFEEALSGLDLEELMEMGRRLTKCHMGLLGMLEDLEAEQVALKEENANLHQRISLAMKDVHALNFTQATTAETSPQFGSLASVGRLWESVRLKPGDAAVVAEVGQQAAQRLQEALGPLRPSQRLQEALGPLRQGATELWNATGMNGMAAKDPPRKSHRKPRDKVRRASNARTDDVLTDVAPSEKPGPAPSVPTVSVSCVPVKKKIPAPVVETVIIEAQIKLTDGSSHSLHVYMVDSCESAARRFIHDHMQRAWFQEPLTEWLKRAETDSETLPVKIEGDLAEIRREHTRRK
eukprot:CAMPEP_0117495856 /NCGR_PEP_ID=MMETSP0784-20121206/20352_1 /TAXON_ID=39447 /ORGANISM="" /LENGTH=317 /DNA_ID=CAMNT_0005290799 /DNA_START=94 /DNA_END=1047 /DNA_ORIENTATION=+